MNRNLFKYENVIRVTLGIIFISIAVHYSFIWLFLLSLVLIYTGTNNSCPLYAAMGVNAAAAKENYYLSQFPKYNPEPVFLFDKSGKLTFSNQTSSAQLAQMIDLQKGTILNCLEEDKHIFESYYVEGKTYMVHFKCVKEIDAILAYAFNATQLIELQEEMINTQKEIVYTMGEIGETRSKETGNHVKRVAEYSYLLAKLYGMPEDEAQILKMASPMHDIGKVGIPDSILKKPSKLNPDEWEVMQTHSNIGYELLKHSDRPILKTAAIVAYEHHEKFDGSGYPNQKKGNNIHIYGRITAIADVFDALGSERVYKKAWDLETILTLFKNEKGKHFDPVLIELFFTHLDHFIDIKNTYQDSPPILTLVT